MRKLLLFLFFVVVAAGVYLFMAPAGPSSETFVVIPPRTSTLGIADLLAERGIISNRYAFLALRAVRRGVLKAGEYRFDHPAPVTEVYARITRGDVYTISVTVPEGYNFFDIAHAMEAAHLHSAQEFLAGARANVDLVGDLDAKAPTLEGYLFPDTYLFSPAATVREMQAAMVHRFRQQATALGLISDAVGPKPDVHRIVTLASLVEKETGASQERGLVASVFENRLARGMPLETDPSVIYGMLLAGEYAGTLSTADLKRDTAYNTYMHAGLPPGPICSPGVASLQAAMDPPKTGYLYFVSDNAGQSRFAATLDEHHRNVALYRKHVRRQGGR